MPIRTDKAKLDLELIKEPGFYEVHDILGLRNKKRGSLYDTVGRRSKIALDIVHFFKLIFFLPLISGMTGQINLRDIQGF